METGFGDGGGEGVDSLAGPTLLGRRVLYTQKLDTDIDVLSDCTCVVAYDTRTRSISRFEADAGGEIDEPTSVAVVGGRTYVADFEQVFRLQPLRRLPLSGRG